MAELVFVTVFSTHMCRKKLTKREKFKTFALYVKLLVVCIAFIAWVWDFCIFSLFLFIYFFSLFVCYYQTVLVDKSCMYKVPEYEKYFKTSTDFTKRTLLYSYITLLREKDEERSKFIHSCLLRWLVCRWNPFLTTCKAARKTCRLNPIREKDDQPISQSINQ